MLFDHILQRGVLLHQQRFIAALRRSNSAGEGCTGDGNPLGPNIISTGTGPFASAGVTSVIRKFTLIAGYDELSTRPTSSFAITGWNPTISRSLAVTDHVTFGTSLGIFP